MAGRIRTIKPELLEDTHAARLSHIAWRLWVSALVLADDYGNFRAEPEWLNGQIFWGSRESRESLANALEELATCKGDLGGMVELYTVSGQEYAHISGWHHQKVDHPGKERCPGPKSDGAVSRESRESLAKVSRVLAPDLRPVPPTSTSDQYLRPVPPTSNETEEKKTEELLAPSSQKTLTAAVLTEVVRDVVRYYRQVHPRMGRQLKPGHKDWKLIEARIAEGYSADDLKAAIDGNARDEWHLNTPQGHTVEYVFRNATKVEGFIAIGRGEARTGAQPRSAVRAVAEKSIMEARDYDQRKLREAHDQTQGLLPAKSS